LYPGSITPFNVWDLPLFMWEGFKASADDYLAEMSKER